MSSTLSDLRQPKAQEMVCFPASFAQQRLWLLDQLTPGRATYNLPSALRVRGKLDVEILERTLQEVARRHETLRTRFVAVGGEPQQVIEDQVNVQLHVLDLTGGAGEEEREAAAMRLAREEAQQPFNLKQAPLFRAKLLRLSALNHVLLFTMHHIVSDAWSIGVLIEEVSVLYDAFSRGRSSPLPELPVQYADYTVWQREWLDGAVLEQQLAYWKQQLAGTGVLELPTDRPRPASQTQNGAIYDFVVEANLTQKLKKLAEEQGATLFMVLLAAFQTLLYRYTGQDDIAVGTPTAGRSSDETEKLIGIFINTLVLRTDLSGAPSFIELLQRTKEVTLEAYAHEDVPFEQLVEVLSPERNLGNTPLFQVMITLQNAPNSDLRLGGATLEPFDVGDNGTSKFDLLLQFAQDGSGRLMSALEYDTDLFEAATIRRLVGHFSHLLSSIVAVPQAPIHGLEILSREERGMLLHDFNTTVVSIPEKTLTQLFNEQVERTPNATAIQCGEDSLSYLELDNRANQLGHYLRELGVRPETRVALLVERSLEMVVAMLGVLKAGGAYVPLDARYPMERLRWMLEDTQPAVLLTQSSMEAFLPPFAGKIIRLDREWEEIGRRSGENLVCEVSGNNLAYTLYTSGSTGRPKAIGVRHSSVAVLVEWAREVFSVEDLSGVLASTSICFDLSVYEIFVPLSWGGKVIVAGNVLELATIPAREQVKLVNTVPSAMQELLRSQGLPHSVVTVNLAGEVLTTRLVKQIYEIESIKRVLNLYGPSEDTTYSTYAWIKKEEAKAVGRATASIGRPITNTQVYVVDERIEPVPIGVAGELYIGGAGLARGYLNRPELTAERFVPDPFVDQRRVDGERLYRTGDLARWRSDGTLEYLGRNDHQVKIRGFRIELGEIEAVLQKHHSVRQAVVIAREDEGGDKRLVAYVVPEEEGEGSNHGSGRVGLRSSELREHLLGKLPEYMVPEAYVELEKIPLNHNGKIDRKSLPEPKRETAEEEYAGPRNATEETLCRLWQEVLRRERVGIHDNFFRIGGHSLRAAQVAARIREGFQVDIPLRRMFESPTIAQLAEAIDQIVQNTGASDVPSNLLPAIKKMARKAAVLPVESNGRT